jgi:hypothetical protein
LTRVDWKSVTPEHVRRACEIALTEGVPFRRSKSIFVIYDGKDLPAKHVLRLAYCLANRLPLSSDVRFSSGENVIRRLRALGLTVKRHDNTHVRPPEVE